MPDLHLETILIDCLDILEQGDDPETILQHYPDHRPDLEIPLRIASYLSTIRIIPSFQARTQSKARFLKRAAQMKLQQRCD